MSSEEKDKLTLEELGNLLKNARIAKGKEQGKKITHKMVADAIGVDRVTVVMWEQGKKQPGFLNILNYCNFLGMTIDELLGTKKKQTFSIELTEDERDDILSIIEGSQQESESTTPQNKLHFLEHYIKILFSRAQSKVEE